MNEIKVFDNERFGEMRVVMKDDQPWFVAADACKALEIAQQGVALMRLDEDEKGLCSINTLGGNQDMSIVSFPGLLSLILGSRKPEAKDYKRWVTHDVLPSIHQTGSYTAAPMTPLELLKTQVQALEQIERKQAAQQQAIEQTNQRIDDIQDTIAMNTKTWREDSRKLINKIADAKGGGQQYQFVQREIYDALEQRAGVRLNLRLQNLKQRMYESGANKSKVEALNRIDVIAEDKRLVEIFTAICKEMTVKYVGKTAAQTMNKYLPQLAASVVQ